MAFDKHTVEDFLKYNEQQLLDKRLLANLIIRVAKEELAEGDDRAPEALKHYLSERKSINGAIKQLRWGGFPPNQTIILKQLNFGTKAKA